MDHLKLSHTLHSKIWNNIESLADSSTVCNNNCFRFLHHNIKSLQNKIYFYQSLSLSKACDVISISETWLKPATPNSLVSIPGFQIFRDDRSSTIKSRGGGAALYIRDNIPSRQLTTPSTVLSPYCNSVWVSLTSSLSQTLIVGSIYTPPDSDKSAFIDRLCSVLSSKQLLGKPIVLLGDFNINWNCQSSIKEMLLNSLKPYGLTQRAEGLSFISHLGNESLIDLTFVSDSIPVQRHKILTCERDISDHYATYMEIGIKKKLLPRTIIESRSFKKFNQQLFYQSAQTVPFLSIASDRSLSIDARTLRIESAISDLVDEHAPIRRLRVRQKRLPWLNEDLLRLIRIKNRYHKTIYQSTPTDNQVRHYHRFRNYTHGQIRKAKKSYYAAQLSNTSNSFFKCLRNLTGKNDHSSKVHKLTLPDRVITDPTDISNAINDFFTCLPHQINAPTTLKRKRTHSDVGFAFKPTNAEQVRSMLMSLQPKKRGGVSKIPTFIYQLLSDLIGLPITILINETIRTATFPDCLKLAMVTPIYKKGPRTDPANYRPISSLPIISKLFEKVLKEQIVDHLEQKNVLSNRQFGFRKFNSTEQLINAALQEWREELDHPGPRYIAGISLDIRKAFDSIHHTLLLTVLEQLGFQRNAVDLIESYLTNRTQVTRIDGVNSSTRPITRGVPQGSVLGPILYILATNDMLHKFPKAFAYADDTVLYTSASSLSEVLEKSNQLLLQADEWYTNNLLQLNLPKTQCCIFSNRNINTTNVCLTVNSTDIPISNCIHLLGTHIDSKLTFTPQVMGMVSRTTRLLYILVKIRQYLNVEQAVQTYKSTIRPLLEYCPSILLNLTTKNTHILEKVQNNAIRIICRAPRIFSVTSARLLLNIPTLNSRRQFLFHKFIQQRLLTHKVSLYLINLLSRLDQHNRRTRSHHSLIMPYYRTNIGKHCFLANVHKYLQTINAPPKTKLSFEL